jgi:hypothetical protein
MVAPMHADGQLQVLEAGWEVRRWVWMAVRAVHIMLSNGLMQR